MILADRVKEIISLEKSDIERILRHSGYSNPITHSEFLGLTNSGDFCFQIRYHDEHYDSVQFGKVYITQNGAGELEADY